MPETMYLDPELAAKADALFRELGLDLSTAVQLFLRQSLREHGLPFTPRLTPPPAGHAVPTPDRAPGFPSPSLREKPVCDESLTGETSAMPDPKNEPDSPETPSLPEQDEDAVPEFDESRGDGQDSCACAQEQQEQNRKEEAYPDFDEPGSDDGHDLEIPASRQPENPLPQGEGTGGELRQAFLNARLIGAPLRRIRSLNRLYSIGEPNSHVHGWREVYVSGDEPFALDFGVMRVELGFHGGGSLRMMDGRLPDEVLEADAVYPRDLSAVFSSVIGQRLVDVSSTRIWNEGHEREQLCLHFANGCTLNFAPGGDWGALWLTDVHGSVMFAPEAVWLRVLDDRTRSNLR